MIVRRNAWFWVLTLLLTAFGSAAHATVKLPAFFSENMVLQRDKDVPVWGWADPEEEVTVSFAGQILKTKAGADGKWVVKLSPLTVSAEGRDLVVKGTNEIVLKNLVVGDVWICSGQSNMEWSVGGCLNLNNEKTDAAKYPLIRHIKITAPASDQPLDNTLCGKWTVCGPDTVGGFTATGYFFARKLYQELNIPIGLIGTNWGGTRVEPWTAPEGFKPIKELKEITDRLDKVDARTEAGNKAHVEAIDKIKAWLPGAEEAIKAKKTPAPMPQLPTLGSDHQQPTKIFNSRILPLIPFPVKGAIWYQGESNGSEGDSYYFKKRALIEGWRKLWNDDFSFYYVQLANYQQPNPKPEGGDGWARLREAQMRCLNIPKTGMAVIIDIGEANDIHPKNKQDVGLRLALWALAKDYGKTGLVYSGPLYKSMAVEGDKIRISFTEIGSGLMVGEKTGLEPAKEVSGGKLKGFAIADKNKKWVWADAVIDGDTIVVSSPEIKTPAAVRYAFSQNPAGCNLYNKDGLPASPFRTDKW